MKYTKEQIETALGLMSGRIDPIKDWHAMRVLHGYDVNEPFSAPPYVHRRKAEEILLALIRPETGWTDGACNQTNTERINELCESGRHIGYIHGTLEGALISDGIGQPLKECVSEAIKSLEIISQRNAAELKRLTGE